MEKSVALLESSAQHSIPGLPGIGTRDDALALEITANQRDFHCCRGMAGAQSPRTVSAIRWSQVSEVTL
jgi:hypothetical protein